MIDPRSVPVVLPHFKRRQGEILFLVSRREALRLANEPQVEQFDAVDGHACVAELEARFPGVTESLADWAERGMVKFLPAEGPPSDGRRTVVVEPHMDDAALSVGGLLLKRAGRQRTSIVSVTRWSPYTSYLLIGRTDFADLSTVTQLRTAESQIAARLCRAEFYAMDERELMVESGIPLRVDNLPAMHKNMFAWSAFGVTESEVAALAERLLSMVLPLEPEELWIPMGLGPHLDHIRTNRACLKALLIARERLQGTRVFLYDELPYAWQFPRHADIVRRALYTLASLSHDPEIAERVGVTVRAVAGIDELASLLGDCDRNREWTLILDGENVLRAQCLSERSLVAPAAGLVAAVFREVEGSRGW
jgi:LmbE family N-acetylglucosaminyl deacetylase